MKIDKRLAIQLPDLPCSSRRYRRVIIEQATQCVRLLELIAIRIGVKASCCRGKAVVSTTGCCLMDFMSDQRYSDRILRFLTL